MSVQKTVPYISLRDIVVATLEGYAIRFVASMPTDVPNHRGVIAAVQAAGCVPFRDGDDKIKPISRTIEHANEDEVAARKEALYLAIQTILDRDNPVDFNRAGAPQTRSLETITGFDKISNAERDAAWKAFKASQNE